MSNQPPPDLISPRAAAMLMKVHIATMFRWILKGKLRSWRRAGTRYMVSQADVMDLFEPVAATQANEPERRGRPPSTSASHRRAVEELKKAGYML